MIDSHWVFNNFVEAAELLTKYEKRLFELGEMNNPPCFKCGYNGKGYYQPEKHPCAKMHHKLYKGE